MSGKKRLLTHSRMKTFRACPRKHYYRYVLGWVPLVEAWRLRFGTIAHRALEAYWSARRDGVHSDEHVPKMFAQIPGDVDPFEAAKLRVLLVAYATRWNRVKGIEVVSIEAQFEALLHPQMDWYRAGKLDLVLRKVSNKHVALVEHKTSAEDVFPGSDYRRRLILDEQISGYNKGAEILGYKPDAILYDVIRKPDERPKKATPADKRTYVKQGPRKGQLHAGQKLLDETPEEYYARLSGEVGPHIDQYIEIFSVPRLESESRKYELNILQQAKLMDVAEKENCHPYNSDSCHQYGEACPYLDVCEGIVKVDDLTRFRRLKNVHPELEAVQ